MKENEMDDKYHEALATLTKLRAKLSDEKDYPMPESYKKQTSQLLELLELREKINKRRDLMTPEERRESVQKSAELDKKIDDFEKIIAAHYEVFQLSRLFQAELEKVDARLMTHTHKIYICLKHRAPKEKFDEFVEIVNTLPPVEREEFYDQVAILEATRLDEILGEKTE